MQKEIDLQKKIYMKKYVSRGIEIPRAELNALRLKQMKLHQAGLNFSRGTGTGDVVVVDDVLTVDWDECFMDTWLRNLMYKAQSCYWLPPPNNMWMADRKAEDVR